MKETLKKIEDLNEQLNKVKTQLVTEFKSELKKIFVENPTLERVEMYVNNHEFNDGDATSFYIGYEDLKIVVNGEEVEREYERETGDYKPNPIMESLVYLFGECQCIHEDLYGDEYEHLSIEREDVLKY